MIEIRITASSAADAQKQLADFFSAPCAPLNTLPKAAEPEPKRRGRKPKNTQPAVTDAPLAPVVGPDQPAVSANNTGSEDKPVSPSGETSTGAEAGGTSSPASEPLTFEQFRAKLLELTATDDGLRAATAALEKHGYAKVKDVKAEHYQAILDAVAA